MPLFIAVFMLSWPHHAVAQTTFTWRWVTEAPAVKTCSGPLGEPRSDCTFTETYSPSGMELTCTRSADNVCKIHQNMPPFGDPARFIIESHPRLASPVRVLVVIDLSCRVSCAA